MIARRIRGNVEFSYSPRVMALQARLHEFMQREIVPQDAAYQSSASAGVFPLEIVESLKRKARTDGLWNLFLPSLRDEDPGTRLTNVEYAPLAEMMGRIPWCSEAFNCSPPDTGNMELLHMFASPQQSEEWLRPLLHGEIRSCFAMTEPEVASSDPRNVATTIERVGQEWVVNGHKWFVTGALHPKCRFAIVLGRTGTSNEGRPVHSMVIVPMNTPGVRLIRNLPLMHHYAIEGHCEIRFENVRVPAEYLLGEDGHGLALAQARLGPGRIHHCMRTIGQCELALELMCGRARDRRAFGKAIAEFSNIQDWIAQSRIEIDAVRLLVLRAAAVLDEKGRAAGRVDVSAIKVAAAQMQTRILDRAMQVFGAKGLTGDTPLAHLWTLGRALRFIDGPDEVHLRVVARHELERSGNASVPLRGTPHDGFS